MIDRDTAGLGEQREIIRELLKPQPTVIGIEGGPCGGKTTLLEKLQNAESDREVVCLPEAASQYIAALAKKGIDFSSLPERDRELYLAVEEQILGDIVRNIESALEVYAGTDAIIVADRCDIGAYVTDEEYKTILQNIGLDMPPMLSHVDQLHYLPSLAHLDAGKYAALRTGNASRVEADAETAEVVCRNNLSAVARHPELHVAWGGDFDETIEGLASAILHPENEDEVKLAPTRTGIAELVVLGAEHLATANIRQVYYQLDGYVFRLRETITDKGEIIRTFTQKTGEGIHRREVQRRINDELYRKLSICDQVGAPLEKSRSLVLLPEPEHESKMKMWAFDRYFDRRLPEWNCETDVKGEQEAAAVEARMFGFERSAIGTEKLARLLGTKALMPAAIRSV